ncbi:MAG: helix-turn-helix domain-containing protein [Pseudomonadota bacterium]|nr:helix-turn-helix domain-containing protein [Pseudomonadota bacterium]
MAKRPIHELSIEEKSMLKAQFITALPDDTFQQETIALYYDCSVSLLQKWRSHGGGPAYQKIGRTIIYKKRDVIDFFNSRRYSNTAQYATVS